MGVVIKIYKNLKKNFTWKILKKTKFLSQISNLNTEPKAIRFAYLMAINQEIIRTRKFSHAEPVMAK